MKYVLIALGVLLFGGLDIAIRKYNRAVEKELRPKFPEPETDQPPMPSFTDIDSARALEMIQAQSELTILHVRTPEEWAGGIIDGALTISMQTIQGREGEIPEGPVIVVCAMGGRSAAVADYLCSLGRTDVFNLDGGMSSWTGSTVRP